MRKPFIVANWKMHKNVAESVAFVNQIKDKLPDPQKVEVGIAPRPSRSTAWPRQPVSLVLRSSPKMRPRSTTAPLPASSASGGSMTSGPTT